LASQVGINLTWAAPSWLHEMRQCAATLALVSGADLKAIQAVLGHASIILTADPYTSVLPGFAPHHG
jgi:site-specific recombinase XerD